jgi:hypothetical protein
MMQSPLATPDSMAQVRAPASDAARRMMSPATLRLAALVSSERDASDLTAILDHEDRQLRSAVAEGLWKRGLRQPLIDRAADASIYPFAIRAVADGPADLANFNLLIGLRPADANRRLWREMVVRLASRLTASLLLSADDALAALAYADASLRRDVLNTAFAQPRDALQPDQRLRVIERLAPLLIELGESPRAWDLIESLNGAASTPTLQPARFQAAALTGHYDLAAQLQPDLAAWLDLLDRESQRAHGAEGAWEVACARLYDEIVRRFANDLQQTDREQLEKVRGRLHSHEQSG